MTTPGNLATFANSFDSGGSGVVRLVGGSIVYTPPANACGTDSFYYLASDGQVGGVTVGEVLVILPETTPLPPVIVTCAANRTMVSDVAVAMPDLRGELVVTDNCYAAVTQSPTPGTVLPFGNTVVTFTATDAAGLTATCQATVTTIQVVPPVIGGIGFTGPNFGGTFLTVAGVTYRVEYKDSLTDAEWTELVVIVGDGTAKSFSDPGPLPPTRFYRITAE